MAPIERHKTSFHENKIEVVGEGKMQPGIKRCQSLPFAVSQCYRRTKGVLEVNLPEARDPFLASLEGKLARKGLASSKSYKFGSQSITVSQIGPGKFPAGHLGLASLRWKLAWKSCRNPPLDPKGLASDAFGPHAPPGGPHPKYISQPQLK